MSYEETYSYCDGCDILSPYLEHTYCDVIDENDEYEILVLCKVCAAKREEQ